MADGPSRVPSWLNEASEGSRRKKRGRVTSERSYNDDNRCTEHRGCSALRNGTRAGCVNPFAGFTAFIGLRKPASRSSSGVPRIYAALSLALLAGPQWWNREREQTESGYRRCRPLESAFHVRPSCVMRITQKSLKSAGDAGEIVRRVPPRREQTLAALSRFQSIRRFDVNGLHGR